MSWPEELQDAFSPILAQVEAARKSCQRAMEPLCRVLKALPDDSRRVQGYLADKGWYLPARDLPLGAFSGLRHMIDKGGDDRIEALMQDFGRSRIDEILSKVEQHWPNRLPILRDAFEAHRQGKYTLSIPATLAQADGVSFDVLKAPLFGKDHGKPRTRKALEELLGRQTIRGTVVALVNINNILLDPLREPSSVLENTKDVDRQREHDFKYGPLNRHAVLHGRDMSYATEPNSLRAILLIGYLAEVEEILQKHEQDVNELRRITGEPG